MRDAKSIVVLGSNCFTGSHIVDMLLHETRAQVVGVSRSPQYQAMFLPYAGHEAGRFTYCQLDMVRNFDALARLLDQHRPEIVIHVAALSEVALSNHRPVEYFEINTTHIARLCNHLRQRDHLQRYVHISSAEIFGPCPQPVRENAPFQPSTPYAVSKAAADMYLKAVAGNFGFPATIIRSTNVHGAHQQLFKIIPRSAIYIKQGKTIELHGGGTSKKSFIHIRDVVRGLQLAVAKDGRTPGLSSWHFSVTSDDTVADVVRQVCMRMHVPFDQATRTVGERLGQDSRYWLDCTRAKQELNWQPQIGMSQGIDETVTWIEKNWDAVQHAPLEYVHKA